MSQVSTPSESTPLRRAVRFTREALSGHDHDLTRGSLGWALALLAIPMVLEPFMESLFAVVDMFFVGRLGADAVAAVGLTEGWLVLVYTVGFGLGIPTSSLVSRWMGEKRPEDALRAAVQVNAIGLGAGVVLGAVTSYAAPHALALMGASPEVIAIGTTYARITLGSSPIIVLLFVNAAVFRGAGDAAVALRALWFANAVNLVVDPILIFGLGPIPAFGLTGAAMATATGRSLGLVVLWFTLWRGTERLPSLRGRVRLDARVAGQLLRLAVGGIGQLIVETSSWVVLTRIVAMSGSTAVAGYTIALRVLMFMLMPAWGLSNAAATLVGQNLGAGQPERAARSAKLTGLCNMIFLGAVCVACLMAARPLAGLFSQDPAVWPVATLGLQVVALGFPLFAWGMVLVQAFNGAGDTRTPFAVNLVCFWLVKLPLAYTLSQVLGLGPLGVFVAITAAYSLNAALGWVLFVRGGWQREFLGRAH